MYHDGPKRKQEAGGIFGTKGEVAATKDYYIKDCYKRHEWGQENVGQLARFLKEKQGNFVERARHQNKSFPMANSSRVASMHGFPK